MAIQGTIKFVNPAKFSDKTQKWSQSIKVAVPGQADVVIYGASGAFDTYQPNTQVAIEQDGQYWRIAKDQTITQPAPGAPMSATPAAVTQGQGYTPTAHGYDHAAMQERAKNLTEIYLQIATDLTASLEFRHAPPDVLASATATIFISTRP